MIAASDILQSQCLTVYFNEIQAFSASSPVGFAMCGKDPLGRLGQFSLLSSKSATRYILLGPVHTSAFSNVCVFVRPKTHRLIRVHTTVFATFSTVHTNTLENDV